MACLDSLVKSLHKIDLNKDSTSAVKTLESFIKSVEEITDLDGLDKSKVEDVGLHLAAAAQIKEGNVAQHAAQAVAQLARGSNPRRALSSQAVLKPLVELLVPDRPPATQLQAARAVGNISFDNDFGRGVALQAGALNKILTVVKATLTEGNSSLAGPSTGCLLNLIMGQSQTYQQVYDEGLPLLKQLLPTGDTSTKIHIYTILGILTDLQEKADENNPTAGRVVDSIVAAECVRTLGSTEDPELCQLVVELLHSEADNEEVGMRLAEAGLPELLVSLVDQHHSLADDDDTRALLNMATDIIVLVLNQDKSMTAVWERGKVYPAMVKWVTCSDRDLVVAGLLALANLARSDSHCIAMAASSLPSTLITALKNATNTNIQHAALSALRNLSIPAANKPILLKAGVLDVVRPIVLNVDQPSVVYKAAAILRMVTDHQASAACSLLADKEVMQRIVEWCSDGHANVRAEASRLIAWLLRSANEAETSLGTKIKVSDGQPAVQKNSSGKKDSQNNSGNVSKAVNEKDDPSEFPPHIPDGAVGALVCMSVVKQPVMQVEALMALYLIAGWNISLLKSVTPLSLEDALVELLAREPSPTIEVFTNALGVLLQAAPIFKGQDKSVALCEALTKASKQHHLESLSSQVKTVLSAFGHSA